MSSGQEYGKPPKSTGAARLSLSSDKRAAPVVPRPAPEDAPILRIYAILGGCGRWLRVAARASCMGLVLLSRTPAASLRLVSEIGAPGRLLLGRALLDLVEVFQGDGDQGGHHGVLRPAGAVVQFLDGGGECVGGRLGHVPRAPVHGRALGPCGPLRGLRRSRDGLARRGRRRSGRSGVC